MHIRTCTSLSLALGAIAALAGTAAADEVARPNSVNVSPLGILGGGYYAMNYERLMPGGHGLLVEGGYGRASDEDSSTQNGAALLGYRWHWRGRQNSGFVGVNAGYARGSGEWTNPDDGTESFDLTLSQLSVTANVGKRWAWDSGLNVTFRIGGGYGKWSVSSTSTDPDVQEAIDDVEDVLELFPIALDGELSVGYTF